MISSKRTNSREENLLSKRFVIDLSSLLVTYLLTAEVLVLQTGKLLSANGNSCPHNCRGLYLIVAFLVNCTDVTLENKNFLLIALM